MTGRRPAGRFEWEQAVLRARWTGIIKGNGRGTRGGVSGAVIRAIAWAYASHAGPDGADVRPSETTVATLAESAIKNVRTVKAALIEHGFLERVQGGARRYGSGDVYRLTLPVSGWQPVTILTPEDLRRGPTDRRGIDDGAQPIVSEAPGEALIQGPLDPVWTELNEGPVDPVCPAKEGPVDPVWESQTGSSGPRDDVQTGSNGTVKQGPVDPPTNRPSTSDQPEEQLVAQSTSTLPASLRLIADTLADEQITEEEARAVQRAFIAASKPRGTRLYEMIAADGGIPWRTQLVEVRTAAKAATVEAITRLRKGPRCQHGEPGGDREHPRTGQALCPLCRTGAPPPPTNLPDPVETYRSLHRAAHGEPSLERMATIARQRDELQKRGATLRQIETLAASAACAGTDLVTHLRNESDQASA
jgi:hypothetical protein